MAGRWWCRCSWKALGGRCDGLSRKLTASGALPVDGWLPHLRRQVCLRLRKKRMDASDAVTLTQQAMLTALVISAPLLVVGVLVGLLIGLAQALTQVQDQTVSFVPKIVAMVAALVFCLPWLVQKMVGYSE